MSPEPPLTIYNALTKAGASTIQAVGIMANIINESGFDPEAVGDQGTSFGIVQEHGSQYSGLVTGNDAADLRAQVTLLAQNGGFAAASGPTASDAAGNFAANYERCVGCQPGGDQYNSRVTNADTVTGWVVSGKWPKSAGAASAAASQGAPGCPPTCVTCNFPHSSWCPLSKTQARALIGGLLLAGSGFVFLVGSLVLASYGLKGTAAGKAAGQAAGAAAGAIPVAGAPITAARKAAGGVRKAAGRRAAGRREVHKLRESGASDLRTARREPGTLTKSAKPGVKTGTFTPEGKRTGRRPAESSRQRARRYAGTSGGTSDKPPF